MCLLRIGVNESGKMVLDYEAMEHPFHSFFTDYLRHLLFTHSLSAVYLWGRSSVWGSYEYSHKRRMGGSIDLMRVHEITHQAQE